MKYAKCTYPHMYVHTYTWKYNFHINSYAETHTARMTTHTCTHINTRAKNMLKKPHKVTMHDQGAYHTHAPCALVILTQLHVYIYIAEPPPQLSGRVAA